jgi:hypothetical protein
MWFLQMQMEANLQPKQVVVFIYIPTRYGNEVKVDYFFTGNVVRVKEVKTEDGIPLPFYQPLPPFVNVRQMFEDLRHNLTYSV